MTKYGKCFSGEKSVGMGRRVLGDGGCLLAMKQGQLSTGRRGLGPRSQTVAKLGVLRKQAAGMSIRSHLAGWPGFVGRAVACSTEDVSSRLGLRRNRLFSQVRSLQEKRSEGLGPDARGFPSLTPVSPLEP